MVRVLIRGQIKVAGRNSDAQDQEREQNGDDADDGKRVLRTTPFDVGSRFAEMRFHSLMHMRSGHVCTTNASRTGPATALAW